mgnify:CR=1 FL=1
MKKITIIFIIVICLLSFVEISCLAKEPVNYGEFWNILSEHEKIIYLLGLRDGIKTVTTDCTMRFAPYLRKESESRKVGLDFFNEYADYVNFLSTENATVKKIIDDLYKDPANTYIDFSTITKIAYQKVKGEDIELLLQKAREEALSKHNK